ncbi:hypothetical protein DmGdi_02760 [Gluconobacter sp. Gdi]|nr:hypothetical protein DmGdi_02760 [Gluconobacter sp. Gdi]
MPARKLSQKDQGENRGREADEAGSVKNVPQHCRTQTISRWRFRLKHRQLLTEMSALTAEPAISTEAIVGEQKTRAKTCGCKDDRPQGDREEHGRNG